MLPIGFERNLAERRGDDRTAAVGGDESRHFTATAALEEENSESLKTWCLPAHAHRKPLFALGSMWIRFPPFRFRTSRITHNRGMSAGTSTVADLPLTFNV